MSHIPVNHHLRPLYRVLTALTAIYMIIFGVVGVAKTAGDGFFARNDVTALGLRTNLAFSVASIIIGALVLLAVVVGRNLYYLGILWGSIVFMVVGLAMLAVLHTDLNVLNFSIATVIVSFLIGMIFFSAGLYGRSGSASVARAEEAVRHGGH